MSGDLFPFLYTKVSLLSPPCETHPRFMLPVVFIRFARLDLQ